MVLEFVFVCLLLFGLCLLAYRGAIHEFQILQKDFNADVDIQWSEILTERLPIVVRNCPKAWLGYWNQKYTEMKQWQVICMNDGKKFKTTWNHWLQTPTPRPTIVNSHELAKVIKLDYTFSNWTNDGFRRWSWLPVGTPEPHVLSGTGDECMGLQKVKSEYMSLVATDGAPLEIWLAHEAAIPSNVQTDLYMKNPWTQTVADIPWISEVKYIEIKLRPGNAIILPTHWWFALRSSDPSRDAWFWKGEFHTPVSWIARHTSA